MGNESGGFWEFGRIGGRGSGWCGGVGWVEMGCLVGWLSIG